MPFTRPTASARVDIDKLKDVVDVRVDLAGSKKGAIEQAVKYRCAMGESVLLKVVSMVTAAHQYSNTPSTDQVSADKQQWTHQGSTTEKPAWKKVSATITSIPARLLAGEVPELQVEVLVKGAAPFEKVTAGNRRFQLANFNCP